MIPLRAAPSQATWSMSARTALGYVAVLVFFELVLVMTIPSSGPWTEIAVAWHETLRRIAPIASTFSDSQSLGARTIILILGFAFIPLKAILVAVATSHARETPDMQEILRLPSHSTAPVTSRIASGIFLALLATLLAFFVLGYLLNSGSERSAIFIMMRNGGIKYWLVWHAGIFTLLSGVLGLFGFWVWDALQVTKRAVVR